MGANLSNLNNFIFQSLMGELDPEKVKLSLLEHQIKPAKQMNLIVSVTSNLRPGVHQSVKFPFFLTEIGH